MKRRDVSLQQLSLALFLALAPSTAYAHGEEILVAPAGSFVALLFVGGWVVFGANRPGAKLMAVVALLASAFALATLIPRQFTTHHPEIVFSLGLLVPLALVASGVIGPEILRRHRMRRSRYRFSTPSELNDFVKDFAQRLRATGLSEPAEQLESISSTAYTTSSEWLGNLGHALRGIENQHSLSPELRGRFIAILDVVHGAWPSL